MADQEEWDDGFQDAMQCPHCGKRDEDRTDYPSSLEHDGDITEVDCGFCGEPYEVAMCVEYTFATKPLLIGPKRDFGHWCRIRREMRERGELPPLRSVVDDG